MKEERLVDIGIPTYNRPDYLRRILKYYNSYGQEYSIIVADSSSDEYKKMNEKVISSFSNLDVLHLSEYPSKTYFFHKIADALNYAKGRYFVLCSDDDFITPSGIKESVDFLEGNPDFTVAHGRYIAFWPRLCRGNKQQLFCKYSASPPLSVTFQDARERLCHHMLNYLPTFYGVHRSAFSKMIFAETAKFTNSIIFGELLSSMLTLIYGKMKCLDMLYGAREAMLGSTGATVKRAADFIKDGTYDEKYAKFRDCLSRHLAKKSQLSLEESKKVIDDTMSIYLSTRIKNREPIRNILIRKIKSTLEHSWLPDWMYAGIRSLYRKAFLSKQRRMDDYRSFADTSFSKSYDEISNIGNHVLSYLNSKEAIKNNCAIKLEQ